MLPRAAQDNARRPPGRLPKPPMGFLWDIDKLELVAADGESEHGSTLSGSSFEEEFPKSEISAAVQTCLKEQDVPALLEASTLLREATLAGNAEECRLIIGQGGIRAFVQLLRQTDIALQEDAVMSLLNLVHHKELYSVLEQSGIIVPLIATLKSSRSPSLKSNIAALLKLLIQREVQSYCLITDGALDNLVSMLKVPEKSSLPSMPKSESRSVIRVESSRSRVLFSPTVSSAGDDSVHNACMALMHLAHFKPVRAALIKGRVVPLLVQLAPIRGVVDSEQSICALFQLLARGKKGPEAICIEDGGSGADTLVDLALHGEDVSQEMAVDALLAAASAENVECAKALSAKNVPQKLASSRAFAHCQPEVRMKVMQLCRACAASASA